VWPVEGSFTCLNFFDCEVGIRVSTSCGIIWWRKGDNGVKGQCLHWVSLQCVVLAVVLFCKQCLINDTAKTNGRHGLNLFKHIK
jgi:hypothetical protein